jgi:hypothetical protein
MLPVKGTKFFKFQFFLGISPVFAGSIVAPLTLTALQRYQFYRSLLTRHNLTSPGNFPEFPSPKQYL